MSTKKITDKQWTKTVNFLRACPQVDVGQEEQCRRFIEAVLWIARSGSQWRLLPEKYGAWNSVYKRFARWDERDICINIVLKNRIWSISSLIAPLSGLIRVPPVPQKKRRSGCTSLRAKHRRFQHQNPRQCRWLRQSLAFYSDGRAATG